MEYEIKKTYANLKTAFRNWSREHPNIMTPDIVKLEEYKGFIIEVSEGRGMDNDKLFGVSVFYYDDETKAFKSGYRLDKILDIQKAFSVYNSALEYVKRVKDAIDNYKEISKAEQ